MTRSTRRRSAITLPALALLLLVVIAAVSACGATTPPVTAATSGPTATSGASATSGSGATVTSGGSASTTASSGTAEGKALFMANCVRCHGADLAGGVGPKISGHSEADLSRIETHIKSGGTIMPAFGGKFTDAQIVAIADYVISVK